MPDDHFPFAAFRSSPNEKLARIANEHLQNDLQPEDRQKLKSAAAKVSTGATIGSLVGLSIGIALAWKIRANRVALFQAFRTAEKPTQIVFASGRTGEVLLVKAIPGWTLPSL